MSDSKHRSYTGALAILFLLTAACLAAVTTGDAGKAYAGPAALPDLTPESIILTPQQPINGYTLKFTIAVSNRGEAKSGSSRLACSIDDRLIDSAWITGINPGDTVQAIFNWKASAGPHIVKAKIDDNDSVAETDENNNEKSFAFSVLAPDLEIESISWSPENPSNGEKVTISATVKNRGTLPATGSTMNLKIDGNSRGNREIPGLEAGASRTVSYIWMALPGPHTFEATADLYDYVKESDETNNGKTRDYATAAPDIVIDSITWSPLSRSGSDNVIMTIKVGNCGSGRAGSFWLAYYVDDSLQTEEYIEGLKAGGSVSLKYTWIPGLNAREFKAIANPRGELYENNETNNEMTVTLPEVLPDLVIQSVTRSDAKSILTGGVIIIVTVKNQGLNMSWPSEVSLYVNELYRLKQDLPSLGAGETVRVLFNCAGQPGPVAYRAVVDEDDLIEETSESNNARTVNIGPPDTSPNTDLTIESIAWAPAGPAVGDTVSITTGIKNKGPGNAGHSRVDYYIDDVFLDSVSADPVNAGETIVNKVEWKAAPGTHTLRAIADCNNDVAETDEENNEKSVTIHVVAPDLIIESLAWTPENMTAGEETTFNVTIKNRGDLRAGGAYVSYYIDGVSQGRHFIEEIKAGDSITRTFTWTARSDSWSIRVVIDEEDSVKEGSESNNEKTVVLPAPDLTIESLTITPGETTENATVTFNIAVKNVGAGPADAPEAAVFANDVLLSLVQFDRIEPGETASGACAWTAQSDNYTFRVIVDGEDAIGESNENNNEKTVTLTVRQADNTAPGAPADQEPASAEIASENETESLIDLMLEGITDDEDIPEDISDTAAAESPGLQKLLMNKTLIIGVGAGGLAALVALVIIRRKMRRK